MGLQILKRWFDSTFGLVVIWGYSSVGRMGALQALGHRFDPDYLQTLIYEISYS